MYLFLFETKEHIMLLRELKYSSACDRKNFHVWQKYSQC